MYARLEKGAVLLRKKDSVSCRSSRSRPLPSAPRSATLIKDASGRSFASFVVEVEPTPLPRNDRAIAIDLDLASLARYLRWRKVCPRQSFCPLR